MSSTNITLYMGAYEKAGTGAMHTFPRAYLQIQPLLLLEASTRFGGSSPFRSAGPSGPDS